MGGPGSGPPPLSDEEKRKRGTFRPDQSEQVYNERRGARVVSGPWKTSIDEPTLPLGEIGKVEYRKYAQMLLEQNKLTMVSQNVAQLAAAQWEKIHAEMAAGKTPSASAWTQMNRTIAQLGIAEKATPVGGPRSNKFEACGFANDKHSAFRLRRPAAAPARK